MPTQTRTLQVIALQPENAQVGEVADGLRDGACTWAREFLCRTGNTQLEVRTLQRIAAQDELLQIGEVADGRRDGTCVRLVRFCVYDSLDINTGPRSVLLSRFSLWSVPAADMRTGMSS